MTAGKHVCYVPGTPNDYRIYKHCGTANTSVCNSRLEIWFNNLIPVFFHQEPPAFGKKYQYTEAMDFDKYRIIPNSYSRSEKTGNAEMQK